MGPAGVSREVPSVSLLTPVHPSCTRKERGGCIQQCLHGPGMRLAAVVAVVATLGSWPSSGSLLLPRGRAQRSSGGLITTRLLLAGNQPWSCGVHPREGHRMNRAMGGGNHFSAEMSHKAFIFLLKSKKKKKKNQKTKKVFQPHTGGVWVGGGVCPSSPSPQPMWFWQQ